MKTRQKPVVHGRDHAPGGADPIPDLGGAHVIQDEGTPLTDRAALDFVGAGVTATDDAANDRTKVTVKGAPIIRDEGGSPLTQRNAIDFVGAGVTATDDAANDKTVVTIPGATGGAMAAYPGHRLGATQDRWYTSMLTAENGSTGIPAANVLRVTPFIPSRNMTVDRIAALVTSGVTGNARLGIYSDDGNLYPSARLVDSGSLSTSVATVIVATVSVALTGGQLYWLAHVHNTASVQWQNSQSSAMPSILGLDNALTRGAVGVGWAATFTFAALPTPYPASAPVLAANALGPTVYIRCT
jgi:hypothetical protein